LNRWPDFRLESSLGIEGKDTAVRKWGFKAFILTAMLDAFKVNAVPWLFSRLLHTP